MMRRDPCRTCGSVAWHAMKSILEKSIWTDFCSECSDFRTASVSDVYFKAPYWEQHMGPAPVFIESRQQKARLLKERGLREAGDRVRGSNGFDGASHRAAEKSLKEK